MEHISVLREDVQKYLNLKAKNRVVDATLGLGGHALDILKVIGKKGELIAFERDERNLVEAKERLKAYEKQITYINDNFRSLKSRVTGKIDAILFDLGLSSPHVDEPERGFSFQKEGPLDMRFNPNGKLSAYEVINGYSEENLADVLYKYGEERASRKISRQICERRSEKKFETTTEFAGFLEKILHRKRTKSGSRSHPVTKLFQAIRMEVNDELNALSEALEGAFEILKPGGRIVVISYHSLEDRMVKQFFKSLARPPVKAEEAVYKSYGDPLIKIITKKPVVPTEGEIEINPRSRSAKLRALEKL